MRGRARGAAALAGLAGLLACAPPAARGPVTITISCGALGVELRLCAQGVRGWERATGYHAEIVSTPNSSTERLALYQQLLASGSDEIDVLQIDVVWPGILASHLADLRPYLGDAIARDFPALARNDVIDGRLVAMPWWIDAGVLYYRTDLLRKYGFEPPTTWRELTTIARTIQARERAAGHRGMWGYVWQGRAYEGLTCDALEWIASFGGGTVVADDGRVTIDNPRAVAALALAASWVGDITPPGVLNYDEETARGVFQTGNAVFMRNWPYAWALAQSERSAVRGKVGVVALPRGPEGSSAGTLGGWQLAVSRYSKHPAVAASLVRYLTSAAEQKRRAIRGSYNPTIVALYEDEEVLSANPFFGTLFPSFEHAVARPSRVTGPRYSRVSNDVWRAVHDVLARAATPAARLAELDRELDRLRHRARW
jgi:trehalose/maltose transport system substrate-binding protein